jgi:hypothetical protein
MYYPKSEFADVLQFGNVDPFVIKKYLGVVGNKLR